jgi:hypothetical protein
MPVLRTLLRPALGVVLAASVVVPLGLGRADAAVTRPGDDAVVVAVIDSGISPYHWDFLASKMPQALDRDRSNDLPLTKDPATWLKGFPKKGFASRNAIKLHLEENDDTARIADLYAKDRQAWAGIKDSTPAAVNYYWFPGTKVIGALSFGYRETVQSTIDQNPAEGYTYTPVYGTGHGQGTSSVSVGNAHGTCPECLIVHITAGDTTAVEQALAWAESQPWIDVISNSYGLQTFPRGEVRDGLYGGPTEPQKKASERGQTIFFSAGNGIENAFVVPFSTLTSSVKGPDWVVTVGATVPGASGATESGSGKPVDVSGIGESYPSAYSSTTVTNGSRFSGTSNAAPTVAGTYARGLHLARRAMSGPSRVQAGGVVSVGKATCGRVRRACEVGDGRLTAVELRHRLLKGVKSAGGGTSPGGLQALPRLADEHWANEGHGTYYARLKGDDALWLAEFDRFFGPVVGTRAAMPRPADEAAWFLVDSWCRQQVFGSWSGGYYREGVTALPAPDPAAAPVRTAYALACNGLVPIPATPRP